MPDSLVPERIDMGSSRASPFGGGVAPVILAHVVVKRVCDTFNVVKLIIR